MRRILPFACLFVAACQSGPQPTLYKPLSLPAERQAAYDACKIRSFRDIPQTMITEITPGYHDPGRLVCTAEANGTVCETVGDFDMPATSTTRDVNEALRRRYIRACLEADGYRLLDLPLCPKAEDRKRLAAQPQPADIARMTCRPDLSPVP